MRKKLEYIAVLLSAALVSQWQAGAQVTIDRCMELARENYPQSEVMASAS